MVPAFFELHRLADDVDDRQLALHFGCDTDRQTAPPGLAASRQDPDMTVGLSSLDKPDWSVFCAFGGPFVKTLSIPQGSIW